MATPDPYAEFGGSIAAPASAGADPYAEFGGSVVDNKPSVGGFLGNIASSAGNLATGVGSALWHPLDTASNLFQVGAGAIEKPVRNVLQAVSGKQIPESSEEQKTDAVGQFYKDRYGGLGNTAHTLYTDPVGAVADASALLSGGASVAGGLAEAADAARAAGLAGKLRTVASAARTAGDLSNPVALPGRAVGAVAKRVLPSATITSGLNPVEQAAVDYALKNNAPVDVANATGNNFIGSAKTILQKQPFSAGIAGKFGLAQQDWMATKAGDLAQSVAPTGPKTKLTAGMATEQAIDNQLSNYRNTAANAYENLYQSAESQPQNVQVGMKPNPSMAPGAPALVPDMQDVAGPTSTAAVKAAARALLDETLKVIPEGQHQMSPSVSLLRQIMNRPDYVDLRTAIADNSAIQNLSRTEVPQLRSQAQRIAATLVKPYRAAINDAAQALGPNEAQMLQDGRDATIAKYDLGKVLPKRLRGQPVRIVNAMTAGDEISVPLLQKVQQHVPGAMPGLARATMENIFKNSTKSGGFADAASTFNKWDALGDQTKQMLFGAQTTDEVTQLLQFAKVAAKNLNPPGTAGVGATAALATMLMRDPMSAIAAMAGSRQLARGLFNTDLARTVRQTGRLPVPTVPRWTKAVTAPLRPGPLNAATRLAPAAAVNPYRDEVSQ